MLLSARGLRDHVRMAAGCLRYPFYPLLITIVLSVRHRRRNRVDQGKKSVGKRKYSDISLTITTSRKPGLY